MVCEKGEGKEIIETDSPNGAFTCCVYVRSVTIPMASSNFVHEGRKKRKGTNARGDTWFTARCDYEHVLMNYSGRLRERQR